MANPTMIAALVDVHQVDEVNAQRVIITHINTIILISSKLPSSFRIASY